MTATSGLSGATISGSHFRPAYRSAGAISTRSERAAWTIAIRAMAPPIRPQTTTPQRPASSACRNVVPSPSTLKTSRNGPTRYRDGSVSRHAVSPIRRTSHSGSTPRSATPTSSAQRAGAGHRPDGRTAGVTRLDAGKSRSSPAQPTCSRTSPSAASINFFGSFATPMPRKRRTQGKSLR